MSRNDAPLYVRSHDLARWVLERSGDWTSPPSSHVGAGLAVSAQDLVCCVSLALTFPGERGGHLQDADRALVRIRILLRLARDLGLLSPGGQRYAAGEARDIGRMLGGWRKRHSHREELAQRRTPAEEVTIESR